MPDNQSHHPRGPNLRGNSAVFPPIRSKSELAELIERLGGDGPGTYELQRRLSATHCAVWVDQSHVQK